jgi:hypothetical protein
MLKLIKSDNDSRIFQLQSGEQVKICADDYNVKIYEMDSGDEIGELSFRMWEEDYGPMTVQVYKLTHAFLEGKGGYYQGHGIATEAFKLFHELHDDCRFEFPENNGIKHDDGSHMTSEGLSFVESLKRKFFSQ